MRKATFSKIDIVLATSAFIAAGALVFAQQLQPKARPEDSVGRLFRALASKDIIAVHLAMGSVAYEEFVREFGAQKLLSVERAYDRSYLLGDPRWREIRQRARGLAVQEYDRLRMQVAGLGKDAFTNLTVDARVKLMGDQDQYSQFLFEHGVAALPASDRARIGSATEFRLGQDRERFLDREGFAALSVEEKTLVGSAAAFADGKTDEKTALHDKFGLPLLSQELRDEIGGAPRIALRDAAAFQLKYGEPLAKKFLLEHTIPADPGHQVCEYPQSNLHGSLLRGDEAVCSITILAHNGMQKASIILTKQEFEWRIARINPALTAIEW